MFWRTAAVSDSGVSFTPASLGMSGLVYDVNYFTGQGNCLTRRRHSRIRGRGSSYYIVAPVGRPGSHFSRRGAFCSLGKSAVTSAGWGAVDAVVSFAGGEMSRTLFGYAPSVRL